MIHYDPFDDVMKDDPFPVYAQLRAESPVHYVEAYDIWALALFEDVWNAGQNPELYPSPGPALGTIVNTSSDEEVRNRESLFMLNPPYHTQIRKALARLYSPRGIAKLESHIRGTVARCLERQLPTGRMDVISDLGLHVSVEVASLLIGLPLEDSDQLVSIVRRFFTRVPGIDGMPPDALAASGELNEYLLQAARERRKRGTPGDGSDALDVFMNLEHRAVGSTTNGYRAISRSSWSVGRRRCPKCLPAGSSSSTVTRISGPNSSPIRASFRPPSRRSRATRCRPSS